MEFNHEASKFFLVFVGQQIEGLILYVIDDFFDARDLIQFV